MKRIWLVAAATLLAGTVAADSVAIAPSKDNTLYEDVGGALSNGVGTGVFAGKNGGGLIRRGLVAFDVAGAVPAGSTITSVTLAINVSQETGGAVDFGLFRATADWGEGTSNSTVSGGGGGAASTTNDATWIHRFFNTQNWTTAGGDFVATPSATTSVDATGPYTIGSSAQMVADVQGWLDAPATNFGWVARGQETTNGVSKRFDSREATTPANRPTLTITYTPPSAVGDWAAYD